MGQPSSTVTRLAAFFKTVYLDRPMAMQNMAVRDRPFLSMVSKVDDLDGNKLYIPINSQVPVGANADFTKAQANRKGSAGAAWELTRTFFYGSVSISGEAIAASRRDPAAFIRTRAKETQEMIEYIGMQFGQAIWRDGTGRIGIIGASSGGPPLTSITLATPSDAIAFHVDQILEFTTAAGAARTDKYQVTKINHDTGVLTVLRSSGAANDVANTDLIFVDGNKNALFAGVQSYIPASDPGVGGVPDALFGVTRSTQPNVFSGWRGSWMGTIEETCKQLAVRVLRYSSLKDGHKFWVSYANWFRLEAELGARAIRNFGSAAKAGFPTLGIVTPKGVIEVVADPYMVEDTVFLLNLDTFELHHLMGLPHVIDDDGRGILREVDSDGVEIRFRAWPQLGCNKPMDNGRAPIV